MRCFLGFAKAGMPRMVYRTVPQAPNPSFDNLDTRAGPLNQLSIYDAMSSPFSRSKTTLPCARKIGWMVRCSISNGGFTWWRHGLKPCEQLPGTRVPDFWLAQRKVFRSLFGGLSWHVLFEADSDIEFYHSPVRWEVSSRLIDPKKGWQYFMSSRGRTFEKFVRGEFVFSLVVGEVQKIEGLP